MTRNVLDNAADGERLRQNCRGSKAKLIALPDTENIAIKAAPFMAVSYMPWKSRVTKAEREVVSLCRKLLAGEDAAPHGFDHAYARTCKVIGAIMKYAKKLLLFRSID